MKITPISNPYNSRQNKNPKFKAVIIKNEELPILKTLYPDSIALKDNDSIVFIRRLELPVNSRKAIINELAKAKAWVGGENNVVLLTKDLKRIEEIKKEAKSELKAKDWTNKSEEPLFREMTANNITNTIIGFIQNAKQVSGQKIQHATEEVEKARESILA